MNEIGNPKEEIEKLKAEIERLKSWNKWFYSRVKFMRECQKGYFRDRTHDKLAQSKAVESEIDTEIIRIETALMKKSETVQELKITFDAVETN